MKRTLGPYLVVLAFAVLFGGSIWAINQWLGPEAAARGGPPAAPAVAAASAGPAIKEAGARTIALRSLAATSSFPDQTQIHGWTVSGSTYNGPGQVAPASDGRLSGQGPAAGCPSQSFTGCGSRPTWKVDLVAPAQNGWSGCQASVYVDAASGQVTGGSTGCSSGPPLPPAAQPPG